MQCLPTLTFMHTQKEKNQKSKRRQQKAKEKRKKNLKHAKKREESKTLLIKKFHCKMMGR